MNSKIKPYFTYIIIFAVTYLIAGLLTPVFADMTFASFIDNVGRGISAASAGVR